MKKFMKKLLKKAEGFTLVELIVVIAILAILAGVAVPAYNGYLNKAKEASDVTTLESVKTAAQAYYAKNGAVTEVIVEGNNVYINGDSGIASGTNADNIGNISGDSNFKLFFTGSQSGNVTITLESDTYKNGAQWKSGENDNQWIAH